MFKRGTIAWLIWNIIESVLLIVAGILVLAWSGNHDFQKNAVLVAGIVFIVDAGLRLLLGTINVFTAKEVTIIKADFANAGAGAAELALGVSFCYIFNHYDPYIVDGQAVAGGKAVFGYVGIYLGVLLIVLAAIVLVLGLVYLFKKFNTVAQNIFTLVVGGVILAAGIAALVNLNPEKGDNVVQFFLVIMGLVSLLLGIFLTVGCILAVIALKKTKDAAKEVVAEENEKQDRTDNEVSEEKPVEEQKPAEEEKPEEK